MAVADDTGKITVCYNIDRSGNCHYGSCILCEASCKKDRAFQVRIRYRIHAVSIHASGASHSQRKGFDFGNVPADGCKMYFLKQSPGSFRAQPAGSRAHRVKQHRMAAGIGFFTGSQHGRNRIAVQCSDIDVQTAADSGNFLRFLQIIAIIGEPPQASRILAQSFTVT